MSPTCYAKAHTIFQQLEYLHARLNSRKSFQHERELSIFDNILRFLAGFVMCDEILVLQLIHAVARRACDYEIGWALIHTPNKPARFLANAVVDPAVVFEIYPVNSQTLF